MSSIIDGINRDIRDGQSHQWQAEMANATPWIELTWKQAVPLQQLEFTFDTGLHRYLRLSGQKSVLKKQIRGPQTETIAEFLIEISQKGKPVYKYLVKDNYMRKYIHWLPEQVKGDSVRITVQKTHGDKLARIFEIRCYS